MLNKRIIQFLLKWMAKIYLLRFNHHIIVIAGTTNRHWIKEKVVEALRKKEILVFANKKNFNAEIGLPLTILDLPSGEGSFIGWLNVLSKGFKKIIAASQPLSSVKYFVLEMAIDHPEDMDYLLSIVKPQVAIFTTITMIYSENFEDLDEIALEYKKLVEIIPKENGLMIINNDDERIKNLAQFSLCKIISYGINSDADFQAKNIKKTADGQQFEVNKKIVEISRFGEHHVYAGLIKKIIEAHL